MREPARSSPPDQQQPGGSADTWWRGGGGVPTTFGMSVHATWPFVRLAFDEVGVQLLIRPRLVAWLVDAEPEQGGVPWAKIRAFQFTPDQAAWTDTGRRFFRFIGGPAAITALVACAEAHGVDATPVRRIHTDYGQLGGWKPPWH